MGDLKFILGFVAGWIATTDEGKKAANELANGAVKFLKETMQKPESKEQG